MKSVSSNVCHHRYLCSVVFLTYSCFYLKPAFLRSALLHNLVTLRLEETAQTPPSSKTSISANGYEEHIQNSSTSCGIFHKFLSRLLDACIQLQSQPNVFDYSGPLFLKNILLYLLYFSVSVIIYWRNTGRINIRVLGLLKVFLCLLIASSQENACSKHYRKFRLSWATGPPHTSEKSHPQTMQATGITHQSKAKSLQGNVFVACLSLTELGSQPR